MVDGVTGRAGRFADRTMEAGARTQRGASDFVEQNPLLTAAIGVAAGAFLAAAFPNTPVERKLMGNSSARLQRAGRDAVSQGVDKASQTAEEALHAAAVAGNGGHDAEPGRAAVVVEKHDPAAGRDHDRLAKGRQVPRGAEMVAPRDPALLVPVPLLAAPAVALEADHLALPDAEIDAAERLHVTEHFGDPADFEHGICLMGRADGT